jgi:U3 small nucleolar RNA-associated protein 7
MYAVAQKKDLFIYDSSGIELHALRSHRPRVHKLGFLPYHFLLCTVGETGHLRYLDVSTGKQVAEHATKLGSCSVMGLNPSNAICHLGHGSGVVTLWSPNLPTPHVRMLCHTAPVSALAVEQAGHYMVTAALDGRIKIWDLRTYREVHTYHSVRPAHSLDVSATGVLAVGHGPHVEMWRDAFATKQKAPYMSHLIPGSAVATVAFCPHEDVLGVGHALGFSSLLVPGAGETAFDAFENNLFASKKQRCAPRARARRRRRRARAGLVRSRPRALPSARRACRRESEVVGLLEKLPPDTITLDASAIGQVDRAPGERMVEAKAAKDAIIAGIKANRKVRKKARGRSKSAKKLASKSANVNDERREKMRAALVKRSQDRERAKRGEQGPDALDRFAPQPGY